MASQNGRFPRLRVENEDEQNGKINTEFFNSPAAGTKR